MGMQDRDWYRNHNTPSSFGARVVPPVRTAVAAAPVERPVSRPARGGATETAAARRPADAGSLGNIALSGYEPTRAMYLRAYARHLWYRILRSHAPF